MQYTLCLLAPPPDIPRPTVTNLCIPSPCGPYSECRDIGGSPSCSCANNYIGSPPNCRPECSVNSDCPSNLACIKEKCRDPCPGSCGANALCSVINHTPICSCPESYTGDPFTNCHPKPPQVQVALDPCNPSPCGANSECLNGICTCIPDYQGDPYKGCRPECVLNNDCPKNLACIRNKCTDPCPGTCGENAECTVINHIPSCVCIRNYVGNAFIQCNPQPVFDVVHPCNPSPCGPNSQCREINNQAVCSCISGYIGSPPTCRPECVVSSECLLSEACINQKCIDPCPGTCGVGANCQVINHNPICSCPSKYTGDPFSRCIPQPVIQEEPINLCQPSPCGPYSECRVSGDSPSCSCLPSFIGSPPNCRPECISSAECPINLACINQKCKDPCPGICGENAECRVVSHAPNCICIADFVGDPFVKCLPALKPITASPCSPSPCGANALCREQNGAGACTCLSEYIGNPYDGCRLECVLNTDCPSNKACINNKCKDPCPGTCGQNGNCQVVNHLPSCTCHIGYTGDPFIYCRIIEEEPVVQPINLCSPSPCGPNSQCKEVNGQAVCSCLPTYIGSPPGCRPECTVSSECPQDKACINQKCTDPCPGTCGVNAKCQVINHNPICSCQLSYTGDPFIRCYIQQPILPPVKPLINICVPSPCGPNSECRDIGSTPSCSCLTNYIGSPPHCRPECTINSECPSNLACMREKCRDPCPGSCGTNAQCRVINHIPICTCIEGYIGDPFSSCYSKPQITVPLIKDKCNPSPCGANAQCNDGICTCLPEYQGDPYRQCRPECVLNNDCPRNKACIRNKCVDPCSGTCGQNAVCSVINHIPMCSCQESYTGNAFVLCTPYQPPLNIHPCNPSPCGPNSQCREVNDQAVCSCVPGYIGSPPNCRPECVTSSECSLSEACVNQKCIDPCPGTCGFAARCQVISHNPICTCAPKHTGDPFTRCTIIIMDEPVVIPTNPCQLSPCGPYSECKVNGESPSCTCLENYIGTPPNCRPECVSNSECPNHLACISQKCKDPCPGVCGTNAECRVVSHTPNCVCLSGFVGDPFANCLLPIQPQPTPLTPCMPSPCGVNAICREQNSAGSCTCLPEYIGNPYEGCRPECVQNSDCPPNKACIRNKCQDPCPGTCGDNADCQVISHLPSCTCRIGFTGDPFRYCSKIPSKPPRPINVCSPSPCGPNSQCKEVNDQAICSCLANYIGSPPGCRPECTVSSECSFDKACVNQKCSDPCPGICGVNANCQVNNHSPICSCRNGYTGDPFVSCYLIIKETEPSIIDPCAPNPCGPNAQCRDIGNQPSCSCLQGYMGIPPNCRHECIINSECASNLACIKNKCQDPCLGSCGINAQCKVINHTPSCICPDGYTGDPFSNCHVKPPPQEPTLPDPCNPSPCGPNADCNSGICTCKPEYQGDPYRGCRPECVLNNDCPNNRACIRNKCIDPCPGTCGENAECTVINHIPMCSCAADHTGNAFISCRPTPPIIVINVCNPSPCGPNSQCRNINDQAVCSCLIGYLGTPPNCRPECTQSSECSLVQACNNQKCIDPCPGTCGIGAVCHVINHNPVCSCQERFTGDPFIRCQPIVEEIPRENPCQPSPCGPNSQCRVINDSPSCSCSAEFVGSPPNCRPECVSNSECPSNLACINQKCKDPCPGTCGVNAECRVISHTPNCLCISNYIGDPFTQCSPPPVEPIPVTAPCLPSPCGVNTICKEQNGAGACYCLPEYFGNPYEGCRPECVISSDCPSNKACINNKCRDPCPGTCGQNADCQVINHLPSCICRAGFTGDPFVFCNYIPPLPPKPLQPCNPSPCGPNSQCRVVNEQAVCSCLPDYMGSPPGCRPECVVSSECDLSKACLNQHCIDPCPGTCGVAAKCTVINHSPICSCDQGFTGDPFTRCIPIPPTTPPSLPLDPCFPSPCGPYSECRNIGGSPSCSCRIGYSGTPPNCKPECTVNSECPSNQACIREKCVDPCPGSCGINALCNVINHTPVCTCPERYTGDAFTNCYPEPERPIDKIDKCQPSPCGANAQCRDGVCTCLPEYQGDPYRGCRPECILSTDCSKDKACIKQKCKNPCPGTCGQNAECVVINHIPMCSCISGHTGNAFVLCTPIPPSIKLNPCNPSPCGPNSQCREINEQAVCSCVPGYLGSPPTCRPECVSSSECPQNQACNNQKCIDPCPGTCGINAICNVINHNPICSCTTPYTGDPFTRCSLPEPKPILNLCQPSPCGPNSLCKLINDSPSCTCLPEFIGSPPNCRPECTSNSECSSNLACINFKCKDPCPGTCGVNAECRVVSHTPNCVCLPDYEGNPFVKCTHEEPPQPSVRPTPCVPSPCGANAICREQNGAGSCTCLSDYIGNPYEGCRPECVYNSDCPPNKACVQNKCQDPCPGICGQNANCQTINHLPTCTCIIGYTGDPFSYCSLIIEHEPSVQKPCEPSPCGPNSQCRENNGQAICSCLPNYMGTPPGCRPECTVSSECPLNKACVSQKCIDPCPGVCGINSKCIVHNHSPICSCTKGYTGDPFTICSPIPPPIPAPHAVEDPCVPSPCGPYSECKNIGGLSSCSCSRNYIGTPPNCRPECTINSDCNSDLACINEKCKNPCLGSCGQNAQCNVFNHIPTCTCLKGYVGDPFNICTLKIESEPPRPDPCNPSPCGPNAICNNGICTCLPEYQGDPYRECRPECVQNYDCSKDKACIRNKCKDPCPGICGQNAECNVVNHVPMCSCIENYIGNAFIACNPAPEPVPNEPCKPSPCGPNSQCRAINGQAVCSCVPGYMGSPPACRPECVSSSDCTLNEACVNQKCIDPCLGSCGVGALCQVVSHNPICSCPTKFTGDPFIRCFQIIEEEPVRVNPCQPSPCGPNAICKVINDSPSCSCLPEFIGQPPQCKPECISNGECSNTLACINNKCKDPCTDICGVNAECRVVSHTPNCVCIQGYFGDPFTKCAPPEVPVYNKTTPCVPSPCGANAICKEFNNAGSCTCLADYIGNPYEGCRPECVLSSDCPLNKACLRNKCQDPCPGTCGQNAICQVVNHAPSCTCIPGYTGDPFRYCNIYIEPQKPILDVCNPSPCGPNSQCREVNGQAVCSCLPAYIGSPPGCRPECTVSAECPQDKACVNQKCVDPCPGTCGLNANCKAINHNPICTCLIDFTGDPFTYCFKMQPIPSLPEIKRPACMPSPCGPNAVCREIGDIPSCSCLTGYIGAPPNCRPECTNHNDCSNNLACISEKCKDPCVGSCGIFTICTVINHIPMCTCQENYIGDPFSSCHLQPPRLPGRPIDLCNTTRCGSNAECHNGICNCLPEYQGDPYIGCRPECILNADCTRNKACIRNKCRDPCPGTCGQNAECAVINHIPTCKCSDGYTGDAFTICYPTPKPSITHPCNPSPCGPNSQCREMNSQTVCSCVPGFIGSPPTCRPECLTSNECPLNEACVNQKCIDPCPGTCGINARCQVTNHNPICSCMNKYTGDPFIRCILIEEEPHFVDPCRPSPCGPNAVCKVVNDSPSCSCLPEYIGSPPYCKPECVSSNECADKLACINQKCKDPCSGICGQNAQCFVISHTPNCVCVDNYEGDPFTICHVRQKPPPSEIVNPCIPSPCGANAICNELNRAGSCICLPDYIGNPYLGCRPECTLNSDCSANKACIGNKCKDPCPGVCGPNADCQVINHLPSCVCRPSFKGDPFVYCSPIVEQTPPVRNPCSPSPCGPNSQCREINEQAVCSCLANYMGSPPGCRPECTISTECSFDKACVNQKCIDPCPGTCGVNARCSVINHSPICSCNEGQIGDPFNRCYASPPPENKTVINPCIPSPCGPYAQCRTIGDTFSCYCLDDYIGTPPNCRPECVVHSECPSNLACIREKCRDPCPGSCGANAQCDVINHVSICTCIEGYIGDPFNYCHQKPVEPPIPKDPCHPSPCGPNAQCSNGICTCLAKYKGDPYVACRPECVQSIDCPRDKVCINNKCKDPCPGLCGREAECSVTNHIPTCTCIQGFTGDPFVACTKVTPPPEVYPCNPSPCGPNSQCREINKQAVCSCLIGYMGAPPNCKPECITSYECPSDQACVNQKCVDPCPGTCGINAMCQAINHNPICSCPQKYSGDPFVYCSPIPVLPPPPPENPCAPSPCGPHSQCDITGDMHKCTCLPDFIGTPPNCRPECLINNECPTNLACINQKCRDPCPGSCGLYTECSVVLHVPNCVCKENYVGDALVACYFKQPLPPPIVRNPCDPSPCGPNAYCRVENNYGICECLAEYRGNPYESCRPECVANSDCPMNRACIRNKCEDPCPGTCGIDALCDVINHIPVCSCPQNYIGDPFRICTLKPVIPSPPKDLCNPSPCGINTVCRASGSSAICECLPKFFGSPYTGGCRPECTVSTDCSSDKACVDMKCVDPCPGICGFNAQCNVINHSPICSCPSPLDGDPFVLCKERPPERDPCIPSPCRVNGYCRVVNDAAVCSYPECVINQDCPRNRACFGQKCRDPCSNACGVNSLCQPINHRAVCSCPGDYIGIPEIECKPPPPTPPPKPECVQDSECPNDRACISQQCQNPCLTSPSFCGFNAECRVQLHRAICICTEGYTGNAQSRCIEIGCRTDSDCPSNEACINRECVNPCTYTQCGLNAICRADSFHKPRCYCPDNFRGNPEIRCERPECSSDEECPHNLACRNERCEDPCRCGQDAICTVFYHRPQCSCPSGFTGNPSIKCNIERIDTSGCKSDADCPSKYACFSGQCKNPCIEVKPCGKNAECTVVDFLPLRTMLCSCLPGYVGDAGVDCRVESEPGCKSDADCTSIEACINRQCINPCLTGNPCASTAICEPLNHKAVCKCPHGLIGNPFIKCSPVTPEPECTRESDCPLDKTCISQTCQDPCIIRNPCGTNAQCKTSQHRPTCYCPDGWAGNPQITCYQPECKVDEDCPYDKACINDNCLTPCAVTTCAFGSECVVLNHKAQCRCPAGTQGNPLISCVPGVCQYNEDCADHEACDRLNRVCRPVCDEEPCASTAICRGQNHQAKCTCPTDTSGNPYVECLARQPSIGCRSDSECPSQLICFNGACQNPCRNSDICKPDQECKVVDTLPFRTVMCQCPQDTYTDTNGRCIPLISQQCSVDTDCANTEKCIRGSCIDACKIDVCGVNAICRSEYHQSVCTCASGYSGNPHIECSLIYVPAPIPECYTDRECAYDKACRNQFCVNPCTFDKPCATGAFCSVNTHNSVCTCPSGYEGNPKIECVAPVNVFGCKSNSDCARSEACINRVCVSPCNCGPNSECIVSGHYPICYCKSGYSGNPQIGCIKLGCESDNDCSNDKQCYNGQCINPCILGHQCANNAECYGHNHRIACRCQASYIGNPFEKCERVECHVDNDCPNNKACIQDHCVNPCSSIANPPCAQNAICYVQNHLAGCRCPEELPKGNPFSYCLPRMTSQYECEVDPDCPSKLACIRNTCVNPCLELSPCHRSAQCSVLDTIPVRTMICTCPEGWVPDERGECHPVIVPIPPGCVSDDDCPYNEACMNRLCRNPCDCGRNAACLVQNHRPVCSCKDGYEGNPNFACHAVGCRIDSECESGKSCINGQCINPCLVEDPCGINAECYVSRNSAECRCLSGYRGNPYDKCTVVECTSNSDCPSDRQCINSQCINPCIYENPCSPRAQCTVQNHLALCRCLPGFIGNPYVDCRREPQPECRQDGECSPRLACINNKCQDPCLIIQPCQVPSECRVDGTVPVRTMICVCPPGYISSGSGTCQPIKPIIGCASDNECANDKACVQGICKNPCNCGPYADCQVRDHKPLCNCKDGFVGNPEIGCTPSIICRSNDECTGHEACVNRQCVPVCDSERTVCGKGAVCYGINHRDVCECSPGFVGNARISCHVIGCRSNIDCPATQACINEKCSNPCEERNPCDNSAECRVYNHQPVCACPIGYIGNTLTGCAKEEEKCKYDSDCPSQTACIGGECKNPCAITEPCGLNADCTVLDTEPVRTMICQCKPGYQGNAVVECTRSPVCRVDKGFIPTPDGKCVCPPNTALNDNDECVHCEPSRGYKVDERGRCVCALDKGFIIDERGNCVCPTEHGYTLDSEGNCVPAIGCENDDDCADNRYCNPETKTCDDPCLRNHCDKDLYCNATNHRSTCKSRVVIPMTFAKPEISVNCLSDGIQVEIFITEHGFNGVLYVKGHSKDEQCRKIVNFSPKTVNTTEIFKVHFGSCGLTHINGHASFVFVIQKHPQLITFKAQAYHIKCVYQTGEQNVTLGFNVSMLTTAGTIANTGPPPTCTMRIVTRTGQEISSAAIGDELKLEVEVEPGSIYGGFARSCVARTSDNKIENEYIVTDADGCATDPKIFGDWDYNPDTHSLQASFNAFKFPSSDNIKFQCNIRVCFGKCQPVNCGGYNAFGRKRRDVESENATDVAIPGDYLAGQLREEITISSNAIFTLERREERGDPYEAQYAAKQEDICVSMIGFIIALIITALLALVAVAVAVSCWLMALRRRPKAAGPLPHPPEFPNPLFTTPEPMAEPSPDYLT